MSRKRFALLIVLVLLAAGLAAWAFVAWDPLRQLYTVTDHGIQFKGGKMDGQLLNFIQRGPQPANYTMYEMVGSGGTASFKALDFKLPAYRPPQWAVPSLGWFAGPPPDLGRLLRAGVDWFFSLFSQSARAANCSTDCWYVGAAGSIGSPIAISDTTSWATTEGGAAGTTAPGATSNVHFGTDASCPCYIGVAGYTTTGTWSTSTNNVTIYILGSGTLTTGAVTLQMNGFNSQVTAWVSTGVTIQGTNAGWTNTSTMTVNGSVTNTATGGGLQLGGSWTVTGTWTDSSSGETYGVGGNVTFTSTTNQTVRPTSAAVLGLNTMFTNCTFDTTLASGTVTYTLSTNKLTCAGTLTVRDTAASTSVTLDLSASNIGLLVSNLTIGAKGLMNGRGSTIEINGNWNSSAGAAATCGISSPPGFSCGTSTVVWESSGSFNAGASLIRTFYNLTVNDSITLTLSGPVEVVNALSVGGPSGGTITGAFTCALTTNSFTVGLGVTAMSCNFEWLPTSGVTLPGISYGALILLPPAGTVIVFGGNVTTTSVATSPYGFEVLNGGSVSTGGHSLSVTNGYGMWVVNTNSFLTAGASVVSVTGNVRVDAASNYITSTAGGSWTVGGQWTNNSTSASWSFAAGITFNSSSTQTLGQCGSSCGGGTEFSGNVTFDQGSAGTGITYNLGAVLTTAAASTITTQRSAGSGVVTLDVTASNFNMSSGSLTLAANSLVNLRVTTDTFTNLTASGGTLDLGASTITVTTKYLVSGGTVQASAGGTAFTLNLTRDDGGDAVAYTSGTMSITTGTCNVTGNSNVNSMQNTSTTTLRCGTWSIAYSGKTTTIGQGNAGSGAADLVAGGTGSGVIHFNGGAVSTNGFAYQGVTLFNVSTSTSPIQSDAGTTFAGNLTIVLAFQTTKTWTIPAGTYPSIAMQEVSGTGTVQMTGTASIAGIRITSSGGNVTFDMNGFDLTITANGITGPGSLSNSETFKTSGAPSLSITGPLSTGSGTYSGTSQWAFGSTTVTVSGAVIVFSAGDYFTFSGNWTVNQGWTNNSTSASWSAGTSTITLANTVTTGFVNATFAQLPGSAPEFYNLTIDNLQTTRDVTYTMQSNLVVQGVLTLQNTTGSVTYKITLDQNATGNYRITTGSFVDVAGNPAVIQARAATIVTSTWDVTGASYTSTCFASPTSCATPSLVEFTGTGSITGKNNPSGVDFWNVQIDVGAVITNTTNTWIWNQATVNGTLRATDDTILFKASGKSGLSADVFVIGAGADLTLGGFIQILGTSGSPAAINVPGGVYERFGVQLNQLQVANQTGDITTPTEWIVSTGGTTTNIGTYNTNGHVITVTGIVPSNYNGVIAYLVGSIVLGDSAAGLSGANFYLGASIVTTEEFAPVNNSIVYLQTSHVIMNNYPTESPVSYIHEQSAVVYGGSATVDIHGAFRLWLNAPSSGGVHAQSSTWNLYNDQGTCASPGGIYACPGDVQIEAPGYFIDFGTSTWNIPGNWTNLSTSASWNAGTGTVNFTGSGTITTAAGSLPSISEFPTLGIAAGAKYELAATYQLTAVTLSVTGQFTIFGTPVTGISLSTDAGYITFIDWSSFTSAGPLIKLRLSISTNPANLTITLTSILTQATAYKDGQPVSTGSSTASGETYTIGGQWSEHTIIIGNLNVQPPGGSTGPAFDCTVQYSVMRYHVVCTPTGTYTGFKWYVNGQLVGTDPTLDYYYTDFAIETVNIMVRLDVANASAAPLSTSHQYTLDFRMNALMWAVFALPLIVIGAAVVTVSKRPKRTTVVIQRPRSGGPPVGRPPNGEM